MAGQLRITGGVLRGRRFHVPKAADKGLTRPTGDKVREAIFSALGLRVLDALVLDLFSGSGAYGFECLSRGPNKAVLIEKSRKTAKCIIENAESLGLSGNVELKCRDAILWIEKESNLYNIVFVDPPYGFLLKGTFWKALAKNLAEKAVVIFRCHEEKDFTCPEGLVVVRKKAYGGTVVFFLELSS